MKYSTRALGLQYFLYFGVIGIILPYFNLYCYHLGLNGVQIGTISALRSAVMVAFTILWAAAADRYGIRKGVFVLCNLLSAAVWILMLPAKDYGIILLITAIHAVFLGPVIAFLEAFTMDTLGEDRGRYGRIRAWGSVGFMVMVMVMGRVVQIYSLWLIVPAILGGFLAQAVNAFRIPCGSSSTNLQPSGSAGGLIKSRTIVFLVVGFLMVLSHGAYYGFFSIHLEQIGFGNLFMGVSWAVAVVSEIAVMILAKPMVRRFSPERLLMFCLIVAAGRWAALGWFNTPVIVLLSQLLHAFTYAAFHITSVIYMDELSPSGAKTMGQSINNSVQYGLGMMAGFFLSGYLLEKAGGGIAFLVSSGMAIAAFAIMGIHLRLSRVGRGQGYRVSP